MIPPPGGYLHDHALTFGAGTLRPCPPEERYERPPATVRRTRRNAATNGAVPVSTLRPSIPGVPEEWPQVQRVVALALAGLTGKQIARELECPESTVSRSLRRLCERRVCSTLLELGYVLGKEAGRG